MSFRPIVSLAFACFLVHSAFAQSNVLSSKHAPADTQLTADPSSAFWRDVPGTTVETDAFGKPVPNHRTVIRSRWTPSHLYLLYVCSFEDLYLKPNPSITTETDHLWDWDVAEAFLGADFKDIARYKEFQVSPQGEWVDLDIDRSPQKRGAGVAWNSGFQVKARVDASRKIWYGEMKIPFSTIGIASPKSGTELRAGLYRIAGREPQRKLISWQATGARSFHVPEKFGILRLQD